MNRHDEREAQISLPAAISAYLGVTEPALFGVSLKYIYPFVAGMIGSGIAGLFCTSFNITANAIGIGGLPGILSIQAKYMSLFAINMVIAVVVPFVLSLVFRKIGFLTKTEDDLKFLLDMRDMQKTNTLKIMIKHRRGDNDNTTGI